MAKARKKELNVPPMASCLLLCDDVLQSFGRGKQTLVGVIDQIVVSSLPTIAGPFVAYVRLSNVHANQDIEVVLADEHGTELVNAQVRSPSDSAPLASHALIFAIAAFPIRSVGRYRLMALHDKVPFVQSPISVTVFQTQGGNDVDDQSDGERRDS